MGLRPNQQIRESNIVRNRHKRCPNSLFAFLGHVLFEFWIQRPPPPPPGVRQNYELTPIVPVNDRLFEYYRQQGIVPEEEWSNFEEALKTELPASFRVQLSLGYPQLIKNKCSIKYRSVLLKGKPESGQPHWVQIHSWDYEHRQRGGTLIWDRSTGKDFLCPIRLPNQDVQASD